MNHPDRLGDKMQQTQEEEEWAPNQDEEEYIELICDGWALHPETVDEPAVARAKHLNVPLRRTMSGTFSNRWSGSHSSVPPRTRVISACNLEDLKCLDAPQGRQDASG